MVLCTFYCIFFIIIYNLNIKVGGKYEKRISIVLLVFLVILLVCSLAIFGNKYIKMRNDLSQANAKVEQLSKEDETKLENKDNEQELKKEEKFSNVVFDPENIVNKGEDNYSNNFSIGGYRGDLTINGNKVSHSLRINFEPDRIEYEHEFEEMVTDVAMSSVYPGASEEYAFVTESGKLYYYMNVTGGDNSNNFVEITQISNIVKVGISTYDSDYSNPETRKGSVLVAIDKDGNCYDIRKLYYELKK